MDTKVFLMTFGMVFLAELGDKTQLTALAMTSGNKAAGFSVFLGSALALMLTSALAVFGGEVISRFVPQRYLVLGSAVLFVVMGVAMAFAALMKTSPTA